MKGLKGFTYREGLR